MRFGIPKQLGGLELAVGILISTITSTSRKASCTAKKNSGRHGPEHGGRASTRTAFRAERSRKEPTAADEELEIVLLSRLLEGIVLPLPHLWDHH